MRRPKPMVKLTLIEVSVLLITNSGCFVLTLSLWEFLDKFCVQELPLKSLGNVFICLSTDSLKMLLLAFAVGLGLMVGGLVSSIIETHCKGRAVIGALLYGFAGTFQFQL